MEDPAATRRVADGPHGLRRERRPSRDRDRPQASAAARRRAATSSCASDRHRQAETRKGLGGEGTPPSQRARSRPRSARRMSCSGEPRSEAHRYDRTPEDRLRRRLHAGHGLQARRRRLPPRDRVPAATFEARGTGPDRVSGPGSLDQSFDRAMIYKSCSNRTNPASAGHRCAAGRSQRLLPGSTNAKALTPAISSPTARFASFHNPAPRQIMIHGTRSFRESASHPGHPAHRASPFCTFLHCAK